jgi:diaminopimelate epimerase
MSTLRFAKMTGAGNDFIIMDNRAGNVAADTVWIRRICTPRMSVGADGLMLLEKSREADYAMRYFNADGSPADMCGNGARCLARFAVLVGACVEAVPLTFTSAGKTYQARVDADQVQVRLVPPQRFDQDIALGLAAGRRTMDFTDTGVPHAVLFTQDVEQEKVAALGREIRHHAHFAPAGTNVNFCQVLDEHRMRVRTYERGVEDETLACGTGVAASALLASRRGWVKSPVAVKTRSGVEIEMIFTVNDQGFSEVCQRGEARLVYWGELTEEAVAFTLPGEA